MSIKLIPKRKMEDAFNASESMEVAVAHIIENSPSVAQAMDNLILKRLDVTHRLQIPAGTDMYD